LHTDENGYYSVSPHFRYALSKSRADDWRDSTERFYLHLILFLTMDLSGNYLNHWIDMSSGEPQSVLLFERRDWSASYRCNL